MCQYVLHNSPLQRGTNELKKYLVSRVPEAEVQHSVIQQKSGASGIIGGGEGVDAYAVSSTKALEYRSAIFTACFVSIKF